MIIKDSKFEETSRGGGGRGIVEAWEREISEIQSSQQESICEYEQTAWGSYIWILLATYSVRNSSQESVSTQQIPDHFKE